MRSGAESRPVKRRCLRCKTWSRPVLREGQPWVCFFCLSFELRVAANLLEALEKVPEAGGGIVP